MWKPLLLVTALVDSHCSIDDQSAMRSYIDDARQATRDHRYAVRTATTMRQIRDEVARHRTGMMTMMGEMAAKLGSMRMHCNGIGDMRVRHDELIDEMTVHLATMDACAELADARAEVEQHVESMLLMMDGMETAVAYLDCR